MQDHRAVNCRSKLSCRKCGKRHNTLLHFESKQNSECILVLKESVSDEETCSSNSIDSAKNLCAATSLSKFPGRSFFKVVPVKKWSKDSDKFCILTPLLMKGRM